MSPLLEGLRPGPPESRLDCFNRDRRRFLMVLGGAALAAGLGPAAAWARKGRRMLPPLQPWWLPAQAPASPVELSRALAGAAVLAPSNWNSQPWRMEVETSTIRLVADAQRALPITDPDRRAMLISLGAALENMLVAMRAYGLRPTVSYFPSERLPALVAEVAWVKGDPARDHHLFAAIVERRTNRRTYDGRGIFLQNSAALIAQVPNDLALHWVDERDRIRHLADLAHDAVRAQVMDRRAQGEHMAWMRFGDDEARRRGDGVTLDQLEIGGPARWFAGRYFNPRSWFLRYGAGSSAKQAREQVRSAGAVALLTAPRRDEALWVAGGQAFERVALKATRLGIAHQPIHAPIEVERYRDELLASFGARGEEPLLFVRLGHAKPPRPSVRRAVALVASFRNS